MGLKNSGIKPSGIYGNTTASLGIISLSFSKNMNGDLMPPRPKPCSRNAKGGSNKRMHKPSSVPAPKINYSISLLSFELLGLYLLYSSKPSISKLCNCI
jgi:hypothetical protein